MKRILMATMISTLLAVIVWTPQSSWAAQDSAAWKSKMHELLNALSDAVPFLYPDATKDEKELKAKVKKIYDITRQLDSKLNHGMSMPDSDPALPYIASLLRADIERAYESLQENNLQYAKDVIRSSVGYCIACHTRSAAGAEFPLMKAFAEPLKRASWVEKIEFQAASRQFDVVINEVMGQLQSPGTIGISSLDIEKASRIALSIAIRVKQDPERAHFLATAIAQSAASSFAMKEGAKKWVSDIAEWKREKDNKYGTDTELIQAARLMMKRVDAATQPIGGHGEVRLLRASVFVHELLRRFPKSQYVPEAFYIVGVSYDALRELGLWSLHEMYFLACVEKVPHSAQAEQCAKRYTESVTLGYTGSSGTNVPKAVRSHLDKVRALAAIKKIKK